ncbi:MAG: GNAT family N-acetyltransferase [Candidatus Sericytochromatia bacterium]|nr:GNAT family N-acetyltransferase [Candidatus Sericytochromatia bacterium]
METPLPHPPDPRLALLQDLGWRSVETGDAPRLARWLKRQPRCAPQVLQSRLSLLFESRLQDAMEMGQDAASLGFWVLEDQREEPLAILLARGAVEVFAPDMAAWPQVLGFLDCALPEVPALFGETPFVAYALSTLRQLPGRVTRDEPMQVLTLGRDGGRSGAIDPAFRPAQPGELAEVFDRGAAMREEEHGLPAGSMRTDGTLEHLANLLLKERVWVLEVDGQVVYQVEMGHQTTDWVSLEGAWTVPACRGRGFGHRGWQAACRAALERAPGVTAWTRETHFAQLRVMAEAGMQLCEPGWRLICWEPRS